MGTFIDFDLDPLCIAAEVAAVLLLISLTWRPTSAPEQVSSATAEWDWEPGQCVFVHAVVATGRAIGNQVREQDCSRLGQLQQRLPDPWRDRLTGLLNAAGMDRVISQWSADHTPGAPASCYALLTLRSHEELMDHQGAMIAEMAIRSIGEALQRAMTDRAVVSRYQPNRFLVHRFASNVDECKQAMDTIIEQVEAPEFFAPRGTSIALECEAQYWESVRSVDPEQLMRLLEDGEPSCESSDGAGSIANQMECADAIPSGAIEAQTVESRESECVTPVLEGHHEASAIQNEFVSTGGAMDTDVDAPIDTDSNHHESDQKIEAYASADDVASLFAELQSVDPTTSDVVASDDESEETDHHIPPSVDECVPTRSIYTDDIEATGIDDDLASLFATVRSSARGSFAYQSESIARGIPLDSTGSSGPILN